MAYKSQYLLLSFGFGTYLTACSDCCIICSDEAAAASDVALWLGFLHEALVTDEFSSFSICRIPPLFGLLLSLAASPV